MLRFFELGCYLSAISEEIFLSITHDSLKFVFSNYFEFDVLTQLALLDFMPLFTKLPWTTQLIAPFMKAIFEVQPDMVEPNLVVLASCIHSEDPSCFDALNPKFLDLLERTIVSKPSLGCSCIYFIGKRKQTIQDILRKP
jgi:hypothetical protein